MEEILFPVSLRVFAYGISENGDIESITSSFGGEVCRCANDVYALFSPLRKKYTAFKFTCTTSIAYKKVCEYLKTENCTKKKAVAMEVLYNPLFDLDFYIFQHKDVDGNRAFVVQNGKIIESYCYSIELFVQILASLMVWVSEHCVID